VKNYMQTLEIWLVGARGGYMPLTFPEQFDKAINVLAIDADSNFRLEQIELLDGRTSKVHTKQIEACVAGENSYRLFESRKCPFASGTRKLDPYFGDWSVFGNGACDYVLSDAHQLNQQSKVSTKTLDRLMDENSKEGNPSILVLDAQGTSEEIITSGADAMLQEADALLLEVELIPFFGDSASFPTLLTYLWKKGFVFTHFVEEEETWATPFRLPIGQRCSSLPGAKDAVFLRLPQHFGHQEDSFRISKYATACSLFGRVDFALEVLRRIPQDKVLGWSDSCPLESFAASLRTAIALMPTTTPKRWRPREEKKEDAPSTYIEELKILIEVDTTTLERVLLNYGFGQLAAEIKNRRLMQAKKCLEYERLNMKI
jgi:hypothetical protein